MFAESNRSAAKTAIQTLRGENPYGGLPIPSDAAPSEIVTELGLDWTATKIPMFLADGRQIESHKAMIRSDNEMVLSIVGERYNPMQNEQVFNHFKLLLTNQGLTLDYAGVLHDGRTYWAAARVPEEVILPGGDAIHPYVMLFHSHKPGNALRVVYSMLRFVCFNALSIIMNDSKWIDSDGVEVPDNLSYSVYHSQELHPDHFSAIGLQIATITRNSAAMQRDMQLLAATPILRPTDFFIKSVGDPEKAPEDQPRAVEKVMGLFRGLGIGSRLRAADGTYWGALNAVTEYIDHHSGRTVTSRQSSAMLGRGRLVKLNAYKEAVKEASEMQEAA